MLFPKVAVDQSQFAAEAADVLNGMRDLLIKKNADYGGASMDLGMTGVYVHIHDKVTRLKSLLEREAAGGAPNFEGIEDTLRDLIGYATIGLIVRHALSQSSLAGDHPEAQAAAVVTWGRRRPRAEPEPVPDVHRERMADSGVAGIQDEDIAQGIQDNP